MKKWQGRGDILTDATIASNQRMRTKNLILFKLKNPFSIESINYSFNKNCEDN